MSIFSKKKKNPSENEIKLVNITIIIISILIVRWVTGTTLTEQKKSERYSKNKCKEEQSNRVSSGFPNQNFQSGPENVGGTGSEWTADKAIE